MLDNLTAATPADPMAIGNKNLKVLDANKSLIENNEKIVLNSNSNNNNTGTLTKLNKTKTILNWLKNSTTTTTTTTNANTTTTNIIKSDIKLETKNNIEFNRNQLKDKEQNCAAAAAEQPECAAENTASQLFQECTCPTLKQENNTRNRIKSGETTSAAFEQAAAASLKTRDHSLHEFRGVQTLKHLWNKRISANKESALRAGKSAKANQRHQFTKSVSCLVNASAEKSPTSDTITINSPATAKRLLASKKRAQSLYDCSSLEDSSFLADEIEEQNAKQEIFENLNFLTEIDIQKHLEKDNFYKYKTAEQALKLRELSESSSCKKLASTGIILPLVQATSSGCLKGERLHWLKRADIFLKRRSSASPSFSSTPVMAIGDSKNIKYNNLHHTANNRTDIIKTNYSDDADADDDDSSVILTEVSNHESCPPPTTVSCCLYTTKEINSKDNNNMKDNQQQQLPKAVSQNELAASDDTSSSSTATLTAMNSPQRSISSNRVSGQEGSLLRKRTRLGSRDSSSNSLSTTSNSINRSNSGAVKRNSSTARRYSFKTHSRTYHHTPRKMHTTKEPNASGIAGTATANQQRYGMVAKLTQQFNELIQKDGKLLDEVKRKNGILMTRNGHVYKIVETTNPSKTTSPNLSRSSSRAAQEQEDVLAHGQASQNELSSDVQKTIRKFEIEAKHTKPKVPLKSNKVLKKSTELAMARYGSRHVKLNALSGQEQQKPSKIAYGKVDKPQTLNLSSLEIVKEEAKTPLEEQEKMAMKEEAKISLEEVKITKEKQAKTALQEDVVTMQEQTKIPLAGQNKSHLKVNETPLPEVKIPLEKQFKSPLGEQIKSPLKEAKSSLKEVKTTSEEIKIPLQKVNISLPEIKIPLEEQHISLTAAEQVPKPSSNSAQHPESFESLKQLKSQTSFEFERVNSISLDYGKSPSPLAIEMGVDVVKEIPTTPTDAQAPQEQQEKLKQPLPFVESDNDDKQKQRKSKYAKIYEKIRFPLRNRKLASQNSAEELAKRKVEQLASSSENMSQDKEIFCSPEKIAEELYSAQKTRKDNKNKDSSEKTAKEIDLPKDKKNSISPEKAAKENVFQKNKQKTYSPKKIAKANSIKIDKPETCSAEKTAAESKKKTCSPERNAKENYFQRDKPEESCSEEKKTEEIPLENHGKKFSSPEKTAEENAFESAEHKADSLERTSIENVFQQSKQKSGLSQKTADESPLLKDKKHFSSPENKTKDKKNSSSAEENDFSKDDHKTGLPERIAKESREQSFGSSEKSAVLPIQENSISAELPLLPPKKFNIPAERNSVTHAYLPMANLTLSLAKPESDNEIYCKYEPNNPESNLLNSIDKVSRKIHDLTAEHNATIINTNTDYEKRLVSKSVLQTISEGLPPPVHITQAVNVTLVNAIEGEQMIMEQKQIQREAEEMANKENTNETKAIEIPEQKEEKEEEEESFYEPIDFLPSEIAAIKHDTVSTQAIEEDIYQSVDEVKYSCKQDISSTPQRLNDYESIEQEILSTKITQLKSTGKIAFFDGYEECAPPPIELASTAAAAAPPPPVPPPMVIVRKTTDVLPELPAPKRILTKSPMLNRPIPEPPKSEKSVITTPLSRATDSCIYYDGDDENIYDTIRGSNCYESLQSMGLGSKLQSANQPAHSKNHDSLSLSSNCYESITQYRFRVTTSSSSHTIGNQSTHSSSNGSTLTISSENKTNSLYEDSLHSSLHYYSGSKRRSTQSEIDIKKSMDLNGNCNGALYSVGVCASLGRSSDNSDEWTDVSDNEYGAGGRNKEAADNKPQFIVVRERSRCHKSPDWSRRVRDKRLHHQRKSNSCIEDDSEPDYEPLSPKRHSMCIQNRTASLQRNQETVRVSRRGKKYSFSAQALGQHISDDSFDSDTDEVYEAVHSKLNNTHNDSGVDVRTQKLPATPAPPSSSSSANQMYSIVKKFKNFIVNKKSPNSSKNNSQQTIYDTSSQFYVNGHIESNKQQQQQQQKLSFSAQSQLQVPPSNKDLSISEKNLIMAQNSETPPSAPQRNGKHKSIRSRLRKSIVGSDSKNLAALSTVHRSTFYIDDPGIYSYDNNGEMDSGFSEKPTSVDLVNNSKNTSNDVPTQENQKFSTVARKSKKESKMANSQRRRTTIGIRPHEPPPPPPPDSNGNEIDVAAKQQQRVSSTSWYAECGVFKNGTTNLVNDDSQLLSNTTNSQTNINGNTASWYEEAGLYQTSGLSVASGSSGSSGVSTGNETGPGDEMSHSMFCNEPLYQMYSAAKLEALSCDLRDGGNSTDGYEEIGSHKKDDHASEENHRKYSRPSALQLVEPKSGPERTLWSQIPEVINSCIIPTMTPREKAFMEAKFEIITSEASYLKSLNLLRSHYMNHPVFRDSNVVSSRDRKSLFAHIVPVHECSEKLLSEMESCWQDNIMLLGLSKRIYAIAEKHFHVYVGFCEQQGRMDRTLKRLRQQTKGLFSQNLELLESSSVCCGLNLHSFLMLPMQRITRLPLLIDAAFSKCQPNDDEYDSWKMCLAIMNKVVTQCNEAANRSEQSYEIEKISGQLEFNSAVIRPLAIKPAGVPVPGSKPRYLVKRGELTHLVWRGDDAKLTFGKKFTKSNIYAFLFSDLLVLTKRKGEEHFSVFDYCPRNMLTLTSGDALPQLPTKDLNSQSSKNLILMTLLENHERKTVELLLSCPSVSEQERWLQAMRPPEAETPGEKLYEQWDCPQVVTTHKYAANEPDALDLEVGDVVNVSRKLPDGWYQGERIRDGVIGWFPGSYTVEVNSVHVRSRNLKQRHRLLTFTATYLESQKRYK